MMQSCEREYKDVRIRVYPDDDFSATGEGAARDGWAARSGAVSAPQSATERKTKKAIRATRAAAERMLPFLLNEDVF